jgi:hypothetical protein
MCSSGTNSGVMRQTAILGPSPLGDNHEEYREALLGGEVDEKRKLEGHREEKEEKKRGPGILPSRTRAGVVLVNLSWTRLDCRTQGCAATRWTSL